MPSQHWCDRNKDTWTGTSEQQVTGCISLNEQRAAELRPERPARHAAWTAARAGRSRWARWCTLARCSQAATASAAPWAAWSTLQARSRGPDMQRRMPGPWHPQVVLLGLRASRLASWAFGAGLGGFAHVPWVNPQASRKLVHPHVLAPARPAHASDAPSCALLTAACARQTWAPMARFCSRGRPSAARALSRFTSSARRDPSAAAALSIIPWRKRGVLMPGVTLTGQALRRSTPLAKQTTVRPRPCGMPCKTRHAVMFWRGRCWLAPAHG